jgi:hypothetical protein
MPVRVEGSFRLKYRTDDELMYTADHRIYLNSAGQVCVEGDPDAASLLLAEGQSMPDAQARQYGLVQDEAPAPEAPPAEGKAMTAPPRTKALAAPKDRK